MSPLSPEQVTRIAQEHGSQPTCSACSPYASPGWESFPGTETDEALQPLGALWLPGDEEPTLEEARSPGVDAWSPLAPISLAHHPANRCEVWAYRACGKPFLRHTEYGGYYEDRRIRELDPRRLPSQP